MFGATLLAARQSLLVQPGPKLYVDPQGSGGVASDTYTRAQARNDPSRPFATIAKAIAVALAGDQIVLRAGSYPVATTLTGQVKGQSVRVLVLPGDEVNLGDLTLKGCSGLAFEGGGVYTPGAGPIAQSFMGFQPGLHAGAVVGSRLTFGTVRLDAADRPNISSDIRLSGIKGYVMSVGRAPRTVVEDFEFVGKLDQGVGETLGMKLGGDTTDYGVDQVIRRGVVRNHGDVLRLGLLSRLTMEDVELTEAGKPGGTGAAHPDLAQSYWRSTLPSQGLRLRRIFMHDYVAQGFFYGYACNDFLLEDSTIGSATGAGWTECDFPAGNGVTFQGVTVQGKLRYRTSTTAPPNTNSRILNSVMAGAHAVGTGAYKTQLVEERGNLWGPDGKPAFLGALDPSSRNGAPTFVNESAGDLRLAPGSAGKGIAVSTGLPAGLRLNQLDRLGRLRGTPRDPGSEQG